MSEGEQQKCYAYRRQNRLVMIYIQGHEASRFCGVFASDGFLYGLPEWG